MVKKRIVLILGISLMVLGSIGYRYLFISKQASITLETLDSDLRDQIIDTLSKHFNTTIQLESIIQLTEVERRNLVLRIKIENPELGVPETVIFKQSLLREHDKDTFGRFARDWAGLEFVNGLSTKLQLVPQFYGGSIQHRFILLEDLGEKHVSLADALTNGNEHVATVTLERFIRTLGHLHADSYGKTDDYFTMLQKLNPMALAWQDNMKELLSDIVPKLEKTLKQVEMSYTVHMQEEIDIVARALIEPGPFTTLIHGDICPDNTFDNQKKNELLLIDFEWGQVRNALVDGTYLRMSMPSCWCAGTIPDNIIEELEVSYRQELIKKIPAAQDDDAYNHAYVHACAYWMIEEGVLLINWVLDGDAKWGDRSVRSRVLSRLQTFVSISKKYNKLPHLRSMAEHILQKLKIRWPEAKTLELYPAFIQNNTIR